MTGQRRGYGRPRPSVLLRLVKDLVRGFHRNRLFETQTNYLASTDVGKRLLARKVAVLPRHRKSKAVVQPHNGQNLAEPTCRRATSCRLARWNDSVVTGMLCWINSPNSLNRSQSVERPTSSASGWWPIDIGVGPTALPWAAISRPALAKPALGACHCQRMALSMPE